MNKQKYSAFIIAGCLISTWVLAGDTKNYLQLDTVETKVKAANDQKMLSLELKTKGKIPMDGTSGAFGYAVLTDGGNNVLVAVTHLPIDDSSYEQLPSGFHTHVLDLKKSTAACPGADFEVDLVSSGKNRAFDADYRWSVKKEKLKVDNVPSEDLGDAGAEAVASFILKPVLNQQKHPTNLCIFINEQK